MIGLEKKKNLIFTTLDIFIKNGNIRFHKKAIKYIETYNNTDDFINSIIKCALFFFGGGIF
ncbi:hypothetical protein C923_01450 [Plasmodium falciparum UGT5.1]|uniref:Uncharacterized protein n=1 Tax=Plasmodium falciparum UGT5.1 TaxID=1237627 RepID=W7JS27_PLAFA|nr:hypothetical protein C923_01450 [Plasmodium falciparum UGT5.1]